MARARIRLSIAAFALAAVFAVPGTATSAVVSYYGTSPADGAVVDVAPVFQWQYDAGLQSAPRCRLDKNASPIQAEAMCTDPSVQGETIDTSNPSNIHVLWDLASYMATDGSDDGDYTVYAIGPFTVGGTVTATRSFTLDTIDPVVAISAPVNNVQTTNKRPTIEFSGTDANPLGFTCWIDSDPNPCSSPFTPPYDLTDGTHTLQVVATDGANSGGATVFVTVDTVAPTVNISYPTPGAVVNSSVPEVTMSVDGATAGSFCRYDAAEYQSCTGSWLGGSLSDGAHTLSVRALDIAGNVTEVVVPFFVDDALSYGPPPQSVSLTNSKGSKVKRGKFSVKVGLAILPQDLQFIDRACTGSATFAIKPKGGKSASSRIKLKRSGDRCVASGKVTLPAKAKRKKATLTVRYHGSMLISSFTRTRTIKKL